MTFALLGLSRAGVSLASCLKAAGHSCLGAWSPHDAGNGRPPAAELGLNYANWEDWCGLSPELLLLACSDQAMPEVVQRLMAAGWGERDVLVLHVSGCLALDVLAPLTQREPRGAAIHPLRAFPTWDLSGDSLKGVFCALEAGSQCGELVRELFEGMGARVFSIAGAHKAAYHASAAMASNLVLALLQEAEDVLSSAAPGGSQVREILGCLASQVVEEYRCRGARDALTGPVERGSVATVKAHLAALARLDGESVSLYRALSRRLLLLARAKNPGAEELYDRIRGVLESPDPPATPE